MFFISDTYLENLMAEDLPMLDVTVDAMGIEHNPGTIKCYPKKDCIIAGIEEAARIFAKAGAIPKILVPSGTELAGGNLCLEITGTAGQLHGVYKLAQNIMEYCSGIATRCHSMLHKARKFQPNIQVAVTRKHFPGVKSLALKAALAGGAQVHRFGLSDSILVFDQHRVFVNGANGFAALVQQMAKRYPEKKIAAEANSPEEAIAFANAGVHIVQCERFNTETLYKTIDQLRIVNPEITVAIAGGVNSDNAADYAATGVDILVTSWVYFGKPADIKMQFQAKNIT